MSEHARQTAQKQKVVSQKAGGERLSPATVGLQRKCACGQHTVGGSSCSECNKRRIQTKLNVSQPTDSHEIEADRMADRVVNMQDARHGQTEVSGQSESAGNLLQPKAAPSKAPSSSASIGSHSELQSMSGGASLSATTRSFMEPRFGQDFSYVRVHTDEHAASSAREFNALAYTVGRDIVFGENQYNPETVAGKRLLAHELTHVLQQAGGNAAAGTLQRQTIPEDFTEQQAQDYLLKLDQTGKIEDNLDSDNKARAIVNAWRLGGSPYILTAQRKILLIQEMQSGFTGDEDEVAILEILERSFNYELSMIFGAIKADDLNSDFHGEEWDRLQDFYSRRFDGGMDALLKGTITPMGYPVPFGQEIPRLNYYLADQVPGAVGGWNAACALGILCSMDSTVVERLSKLTVKEMDRIDVQKWTFDGAAWSSETVHPSGLNEPGQGLVGIIRGRNCNGAAQTLYHEAHHQHQPAQVRATIYDMEVDAYSETEKWAIARGLPEPGGRKDSYRTTDKAGKEAPDTAVIEQMVEQKYGGKMATPGDEIVGHEAPAKTVVKHPDGSTSKVASVKGHSYLADPPTLINEKPIPASVWECPKTKKP